VRQDVVRYYAQCLAQHGHTLTPDHLVGATSVYVADSREQAAREAGPSWLYFTNTLFGHGSIRDPVEARRRGYLSDAAYDYMRPEVREAYLRSRQTTRTVTLDDVLQGNRLPWGNPDEVRDALIRRADMDGTNIMLLTMNTGGLPHKLFMRNLKRFGEEVLPELKEHQVALAPVA
ncbi:MAG: LLM class flavin-dependent oxidoreductase, partial [Dehalococcoidia bacterium]